MKTLFILLSIIFFSFTSKAQNYPEMILVEGGTFNMGDLEWEGQQDENPVHLVTLNSFKIAKTEITVLQFRTYCNATGHAFPNEMIEYADNSAIGYINYSDAISYCNWLSDKTGLLYRLPTEAEWEYAAKGGLKSQGLRHSGADNLEAVGWYTGNSGSHPHPVGA